MRTNTHFQIIRVTALAVSLCFAQLSHAASPPADHVTSETIKYGRAGVHDLLLDVYYPPATSTLPSESTSSTQSTTTTRRPAIVFVHGGGWAAGDKSAFGPFAKFFAEQGFVAISVGYRLVRPLTNKWPSQIDDLQLAVRWIRSNADRFNIEPERIGGMGGSAGGHLVSLLGLIDTRTTAGALYPEHSSRLQCIVNLFGPSDFTRDFPTTGPIGSVQALVDGLLGAPAKQVPEIARDASPVFHANSDTSFLIFQGDRDELVPVEQAIRLHKALEKAGADSTLVILKDEGHGLKPENHKRFMEESLAFFKKHLGPIKEPRVISQDALLSLIDTSNLLFCGRYSW